MESLVRTSGQLGPLLKQLRKAKQWSQFELGQKIGLSQERISAIENHPERVTFDQLLTVLMALDAELIVHSPALLSAHDSLEWAMSADLAKKSGESW